MSDDGNNTDISISYQGGKMIVRLEEFFGIHNITKVKKLLNLIRISFTPECEEEIKKFVQREIEQTEQNTPAIERYIAEYEEKIVLCKREIQRLEDLVKRFDRKINYLKQVRDSHRKGTKIWKVGNDDVKECSQKAKLLKNELKLRKEQLTDLKGKLRRTQSELKSSVRSKDFYEKVLGLIGTV